ncbi:MAG: ribonuclease III domain-containing protein [Evtepia gabavorous]
MSAGQAHPRGPAPVGPGLCGRPRQAALLEKLLPVLRPEETQVFKRGRNANPHSHPRGATRREYQVATGLEALFGWLYLRGETGRLNELFEMMMEGED